MERKAVSGIMLILFLIGMYPLAFNVQSVMTTETIYIRADGSVDPATAPIQRDGDVYTFIYNIYDSIVVQRDDIVIDGAGYTVQGTGSGTGIVLSYRKNVTIKNANIKGFDDGIYLSDSSGNTIVGNNVTENYWYGLRLVSSNYNSVSENNVTANYSFGIYLDWSLYNSIVENNFTANYWFGVYFHESSTNSLVGNIFVNDGLAVSDSYGNVVVNNLVNDKPLIYLENVSDYVVGDAGQVILINCNRIKVENLNLSHTAVGVQLWQTNDTEIIGNSITANNQAGIMLEQSLNNIVYGNNITNNEHGVLLRHSSNIGITGNNIKENNGYGIWLSTSANNNSISANTITNNYQAGVGLIYGPLNNRISGNDIMENDHEGIVLYDSSNNSIIGNNIKVNDRGILLYWNSNYSTISGNNVTNNGYGVYLYKASNNVVYHNNFIDNTVQAYMEVAGYENSWDNGYPSGGNYWSDYEARYPDAKELDSSGIWDTPYEIVVDNRDNYPLMNPWSHPPPILTTIDDLKIKIEEFRLEGEIYNQGIANSLIAKLNTVQKLVDKGKIDEAKTILEDGFIPQVQNLSGIHITVEAADILIKSAEYIISQL